LYGMMHQQVQFLGIKEYANQQRLLEGIRDEGVSMNIKFFRVLSNKPARSRGIGCTSIELRYDSNQFKGASCSGIDTEFFYPAQDKFEPGEAELLKRICVDCPVMEACLEWGIVMERYGVWGGTTPVERLGIRKRLNLIVSNPQHNS
jgi:WhiB family redox-sensing transcriptional regulator